MSKNSLIVGGDILANPRLALCDNREITPKLNARNGSPEEWFSEENLSQFGLVPISVDFFVNWNESPIRLTRNVWVKKILKIDPDLLSGYDEKISVEKVSDIILSHEGSDKVRLLCDLFSNMNINIDYLLFRDIDWKGNLDERIVLARPRLQYGKVEFSVKYIDLEDLKSRIRLGSGGDVRVGRKGLTFGTSTLECYLSKTKYAYPGDADLVLVEKKTGKAISIFEFKKHNLSTSITDQKLSNYYPRPDQRKYDRLAIFRDYIDPLMPLVNLYYPTGAETKSKLEMVKGAVGSLFGEGAACIEMPSSNDNESKITYIKMVLDFINYKL